MRYYLNFQFRIQNSIVEAAVSNRDQEHRAAEQRKEAAERSQTFLQQLDDWLSDSQHLDNTLEANKDSPPGSSETLDLN